MDINVSWFMEKKVERTLAGLAKHNIGGFYVENEIGLIKKLEELIPQNSVVGVGDSMTLFETGVIEFLRKGYNSWENLWDIKSEQILTVLGINGKIQHKLAV